MSDEWIKITDSMPPIDKEIELLSLSRYPEIASLKIGSFSPDVFQFIKNGNVRICNVTHWRPIKDKEEKKMYCGKQLRCKECHEILCYEFSTSDNLFNVTPCINCRKIKMKNAMTLGSFGRGIYC